MHKIDKRIAGTLQTLNASKWISVKVEVEKGFICSVLMHMTVSSHEAEVGFFLNKTFENGWYKQEGT